MGEFDRGLAQFFLGPLFEDPLKIRVVYVMQASKTCQDIRGEVLEDVCLSRVSGC